MNVLLTGFNRFGSFPVNTSQLLIEELGRRNVGSGQLNIVTQILPTEFRKSGILLEKIITTYRPRIILSAGISSYAYSIKLERFALNIDDTDVPDNRGYIPKDKKIKPDGAEAYRGNFPLEQLQSCISGYNFPVYISNHAGSYVCNHVYYVGCYLVRKLRLPALHGFIHLPTIDETNEGSRVNMVQLADSFEHVIHLLYNHTYQKVYHSAASERYPAQ